MNGTERWGRIRRQDIDVSLALWLDLSEVIQTDSVHATVNYATVTKEIASLVEASDLQYVASIFLTWNY